MKNIYSTNVVRDDRYSRVLRNGSVRRVFRDQLRRQGPGGNLLRLHQFEAKLKAGNEVARFMLRGGPTTGNSEGSKSLEETETLVA